MDTVKQNSLENDRVFMLWFSLYDEKITDGSGGRIRAPPHPTGE